MEPVPGPEWNEMGCWFSAHLVLGESPRGALLIEGGIRFERGVILAFLALNSAGDEVMGSGRDGIRIAASLENEARETVNYIRTMGHDDLLMCINGAGSSPGRLEFQLWVSPRPLDLLWITSEWPDYDIPLSTKKLDMPPLVSLPNPWNPEAGRSV